MTSRYDKTEPPGCRVVPERSDEGKNVVGANGMDIGMVMIVVESTLYVAPNTRLSNEVERKLDWDNERSMPLPVPSELITRIDEEVVLAVEREAE